MQLKYALILLAVATQLSACKPNLTVANSEPATAVPVNNAEAAPSVIASDARTQKAGGKDVDDLNSFIQKGEKLLAAEHGDLRGMGQDDVLLVVDPPINGNEMLGQGSARNVVLLVRNQQGILEQKVQNNKIIPCQKCGGVAGDPFGFAKISNGSFTLATSGGSRERWSNEYTFKYAAIPADWMLEKVTRSVVDIDSGENKSKEFTNKDFGEVRFANFSPDALPMVEFE